VGEGFLAKLPSLGRGAREKEGRTHFISVGGGGGKVSRTIETWTRS